MGDYLLPAERRRHDAPDVRPSRARGVGARNTHAKPHSKPSTAQGRSVRSLRAKFEMTTTVPPVESRTNKNPAAAKTQLRNLLSQRHRDEDANNVGALINRFDKVVLGERNGIPIDAHHVGTPVTADTFNDFPIDQYPKTDPGLDLQRINQAKPPTEYAQVPLTTQQSVRETHAFARNAVIRRSRSAMEIGELEYEETAALETLESIADVSDLTQEHDDTEVVDDWNVHDERVRAIFGEAQITAEHAVRCDENEDYEKALELYIQVIELYHQVSAFLTTEEQLEVRNTVSMYTRRCEVIKDAFADEGDELLEPELEAELAEEYAHPPSTEDVLPVPEATQVVERPVENQSNLSTLTKSRLPDYRAEPTNIPDASQRPGLIPHAHRSSLQRPLSRAAVKKATASMTRERVNEIEEKLKLMKDAFHNFTVKRKHLGPARAVEMGLTELNVKTFGEYKKLQPLSDENIHKWKSELEVLLGMLEEIKDDAYRSRQRADIAKHLPNLKKYDDLIVKTMTNFNDIGREVEYVSNDSKSGSKSWWVKVPVVQKGGLSMEVRNMLDDARRDLESVHKLSHEANMDVVKSMKVPDGYVDTLPRHARHLIPKDLKEGLMNWGMFKISDYMKDRGMYNKEKAAELCSALEKVELVWSAKSTVKSIFSRTLDTLDIRGDRGKQIMNALRRCQNAIRDLRREFITMKQTELDMQKVAKCEDIGQAGLEAYSRALESRAHIVLSRVLDVLRADDEEKAKSNLSRSMASRRRK